MKLKLLEINAVPYGSTGKIVAGIAQAARAEGYKVQTYNGWTKKAPRGDGGELMVGSFVEKAFHMAAARLTGYEGVFSRSDTRRLLREIDAFEPDIIHLHLMHNWYLHLPMLFDYLKKHPKIHVVWTMHDCWAFTGHCPHFIMEKCERWRTECHHCPNLHEYPATYIDHTREMRCLKEQWFTGLPNATIVTPSRWLAELIGQSFLRDYPVRVIHNGIDLNVFTSEIAEDGFRARYSISQDQKLILGVAFDWGKRKGLDVFIELAGILDESFRIVLVGTDNAVDVQIPPRIISIHRTFNQQELAQIYAAADVFVNPTREDNFPTVNLESLACGTPVITYRTGGSPEMLDETCGSVVEVDDFKGLVQEIERVCSEKPYSAAQCVRRASLYSQTNRFRDYLELFANGVCSHQDLEVV